MTRQGPDPAPTKTCSFDEQEAFTDENEEVLLGVLAVIHAARLPGLEQADVDPDFGEAHVALEAREPAEDLVVEPARLAGVDDEPAFALGGEPSLLLLQLRFGDHLRSSP
jgi:hypothetical protein